MVDLKHVSANENHYDHESFSYDVLNEERSYVLNGQVERILRTEGVKTFLDLSCGTGSQVFWLHKHGFEGIGVDINTKMLAVAAQKNTFLGEKIVFKKGDMRSSVEGCFDAVVTMFNAIGHLTRDDFLKTVVNVGKNLRSGGVYVCDIFNVDFLRNKNNITALTIDWMQKNSHRSTRKIQYSIVTQDGVLFSYTTMVVEDPKKGIEISPSVQSLQLYSKEELKDIFMHHGFDVVSVTGCDGSMFDTNNTERMLFVVRKR
jgi:SAM-dependent methyltransferase